jgi:hypothetical protein
MKKSDLMDWEERNALKMNADYRTVEGALDVMRADYEVSKEAWYYLSRKRKGHPTFEEYAKAYVANNLCLKLFGEDVFLELQELFPPKHSYYLQEGHVHWLITSPKE